MLIHKFTGQELYVKRPAWYLGRCYWLPNTDEIVMAPVPFNFLIGWGYEAWWRIKRGPDGMQERLREARSAGFRKGLEAGERRAVEAAKFVLRAR